VIENRAQHLGELSVSVGVLLQLGADLGQGERQIPVVAALICVVVLATRLVVSP
jgi:hypothetical protein